MNARREGDGDERLAIGLRCCCDNRRCRQCRRAGRGHGQADHAENLVVSVGRSRVRLGVISRACRLRVAELQRRGRRVDVSLDDEGLEKDRKQCDERCCPLPPRRGGSCLTVASAPPEHESV